MKVADVVCIGKLLGPRPLNGVIDVQLGVKWGRACYA